MTHDPAQPFLVYVPPTGGGANMSEHTRAQDEILESLEADVRRLMHAHADIPPRGWDSHRQRRMLHAEIDDLLDLYKLGGNALAPELQEAHDDHAHGDPWATECGVCGRSRYANGVGARICAACDGGMFHGAGGTWETLA